MSVKNNSKQNIKKYIYFVYVIQYSITEGSVNSLESQLWVKIHFICVSMK